MTKDEILDLTPQERVAGFLLRSAKVTEVGCRLRIRHAHESTQYDECWTEEESAEWEEAVEECELWWLCLSSEEHAVIHPIEIATAALCRGEWPIPELVMTCDRPNLQEIELAKEVKQAIQDEIDFEIVNDLLSAAAEEQQQLLFQ